MSHPSTMPYTHTQALRHTCCMTDRYVSSNTGTDSIKLRIFRNDDSNEVANNHKFSNSQTLFTQIFKYASVARVRVHSRTVMIITRAVLYQNSSVFAHRCQSQRTRGRHFTGIYVVQWQSVRRD